MTYSSHLIAAGTGEPLRARVIRPDMIDVGALSTLRECLKAGDWSPMERSTGLGIMATSGPDVLSAWLGPAGSGTPIALALALPEANEAALRSWHRIVGNVYRSQGVEPSADWIDLMTDYPATVEVALPGGTQEQHGVAGALVMVWGWAVLCGRES